MKPAELVTHTLGPVWDSRSRVLILGTMPSPASRAQGFYYGHPQNRFWKVLAAVLEQQEPSATPEARRAFVLQNGIVLFDVLQSCEIVGAADASIRKGMPNDFGKIFAGAEIRGVFTTGAKAYALYESLCRKQTGRPAVSLPSTSAANCRMPLGELIRRYRVLREYLE